MNQSAWWPLGQWDIPMAECLRCWFGEQWVGWSRVWNPVRLLALRHYTGGSSGMDHQSACLWLFNSFPWRINGEQARASDPGRRMLIRGRGMQWTDQPADHSASGISPWLSGYGDGSVSSGLDGRAFKTQWGGWCWDVTPDNNTRQCIVEVRLPVYIGFYICQCHIWWKVQIDSLVWY